MGEPVGAPVELGVGHLPALAGEGHRRGEAPRLDGHEVVQAEILPGRRPPGRVVPLQHELVPLGRGEERQLAEGAPGSGGEGAQQPLEVDEQAARRRRVGAPVVRQAQAELVAVPPAGRTANESG